MQVATIKVRDCGIILARFIDFTFNMQDDWNLKPLDCKWMKLLRYLDISLDISYGSLGGWGCIGIISS